MKSALLLLLASSVLSAETLSVTLKKRFWPDGEGSLAIDSQGFSYKATDGKQQLHWGWLDIQYFDRISRQEFVLRTYQDQRLLLGRDREYRFVVTGGELSDDLFAMVSRGLNRPVTDRVPPETAADAYAIPVKRTRTFGGSEGKLVFTGDAIQYITQDKADGRTWLLDRDIVSVWSSDPYRLEIRAYENNRREFSRTATYKFDLKERLDPTFYRGLKLKLYRLEADGEVVR